MPEKSFVIRNKLGLHARPASLLAQTAARFPCRVEVRKNGSAEWINGKSILGLLTLAAGAGTTIAVRCEGPRAEECLAAIAELIEVKKFEEE